MTYSEAVANVRKLGRKTAFTNEEEFVYIESLEFIIENNKDTRAMMELGGYYYEKKKFDLALKYYELAAEYKDPSSYGCLGYIWYYGRTGVKDYEKAFKYYSLSADTGNIESAYKVADMYKNGYYVEKNYEKYKSEIERLFELVKDDTRIPSPLPSIFIRLAKIRTEEKNFEEAVNLYLYAKNYLSQMIKYNPFFGNLSNMRWIEEELYQLIELDYHNLDFFDLYEVLKKPCKVTFHYEGNEYEVESLIENEELVVNFMGVWYHTIDEFFQKAMINGKKLSSLNRDLHLFEVK